MLCELRRDAKDQVAALAAQLRTVTDEGALAHGEGPSEWFLGLAQAWSGAPVEGHARIERAYRRYAQVGMQYGASEVLGYAAEALVLAGDHVGALRQVEEALVLAERLHDHSYRARLLLLKRRIARAQGAEGDADEVAQQALLEVRRQQVPWLEMTVLVELCEALCSASEDIDALRGVVAGMPEASNAPLMNRARALLTRH
jgi:hypothetical protein